jgi:hypothetical protein
MDETVSVKCECGTEIIVLPPKVYEAMGDSFGGLEAELAYREALKSDTALTGARLTIRDPEGVFYCPECGRVDQIPPDE